MGFHILDNASIGRRRMFRGNIEISSPKFPDFLDGQKLTPMQGNGVNMYTKMPELKLVIALNTAAGGT